jgi:glyoxylase-like metal-dependent hydrolase (beta-lactamase superfamily II)
VAVVDPGPDLPRHVRAVVRAVEDAATVRVLLTHGHADHAGAVDALLAALPGTPVLGAGHPAARPMEEGAGVSTDHGTLVAVRTPGHTEDHLCFHWPERSALFAGDLVLGMGDTTWVGEYPGCVADYLASLERVAELSLDRVHPAHGPDLHDPAGTWRAYRRHREERIRQVREALRALGEVDAGRTPHPPRGDGARVPLHALMARVYGDDVPAGLQGAARASLEALVEYVRSRGPASEAGAGS